MPVLEGIVDTLPYFIAASLIAAAATLLIGISRFATGGRFDARFAQFLLNLRVGFQALSVLLIVAYIWLTPLPS